MKKVIQCLAIVLIGVLLVTGCSRIAYNATLYDDVGQWIKDSFANENLTRDAHYHSDDEPDGIFVAFGDAYPLTRSFIVDTQEAYDEIFVSNVQELGIDFDKKILIVYTYTASVLRGLKLLSVSLQGTVLKIKYKTKTKFSFAAVGDAPMPYQRWVAVKLDKVDVASVEFEEK